MNNTRSLKKLLSAWQTAVAGTSHPQPPNYDGPDISLTGLIEHSDDVTAGSCFVARVRTGTDGHRYIGKAIENGASAILAQKPIDELGCTIPENVVYLQVADTAESLAWLSAAWYDFPSEQMVMIGITGTNGKTSTAEITQAILRAAGLQVGMVSTLKAMIGEHEEPLALHVSTPEAPVVQAFLRRMVDAGITHCILETTSHGLAQHRVSAINFDIAAITNITHEHLDYHGSFAEYFAAKAHLFTMLSGYSSSAQKPVKLQKTAVLNLDDSSYAKLSQIPAPQQLSYAITDPTADLRAINVVTEPTGSTFELNLTQRRRGAEKKREKSVRPFGRKSAKSLTKMQTKLVGLYNVYNILAAAGIAQALGIEPNIIQAGLQQVDLIHGRMHPIKEGQNFLLHVDFAHTPDGLDKTIEAGRKMLADKNGRVIALFGSAGKRDPEKRRMMAEISAEKADLTILTAEDPRTESLDDILEAMAQGCLNKGGVEGGTFWRIRDRGQAIYFALSLAQPSDNVLICGKGHEQSMCFGTIEHPWDDIDATVTAVHAFLAGKPMPDLGLPTFEA